MALYFPICSKVSISGPASITPPVTKIQGLLILPAPIKWAGIPLSQLATKTLPSKGVALLWISIIPAIISLDARE